MFDSRSPAVKVGGYIIIGFFVLIIAITFGMPDFMSKMGMDRNTVAVVNGETIQHIDFVRYRDLNAYRYGNAKSDEMQKQILDRMIQERLLIQKAKDLDIRVSDKEVKNLFHRRFANEQGKFDESILQNFMQRLHVSITDYFQMVKDELYLMKLQQLVMGGVGVSPEEVSTRYTLQNSSMRIRYCYVSSNDLKKRFASGISVTDSEVEEEMEKNPSEIKDPKSDRKRIREKLENQKFEEQKAELVKKLDSLAFEGTSFNKVAGMLGGKISTSNQFAIGEPVREQNDKGSVLYAISESNVFRSDALAIDIGKSSRVIQSFDGLYVFTPVKKQVPFVKPPQDKYEAIEKRVYYAKANSLYMSLLNTLYEESEIVKNLQTGE